MYSLQLFGGLSLKGERGPITGPAVQRHRLGLVALLAAHRDGVSRDKLVAYLWPERDTPHARNLLKQAVHALRRALGDDAILAAGDELRLNPSVVRSDLTEFEDSLRHGERARAVELYAGDFLDGFFLKDSSEFERWVDRERARLAHAYASTLEKLADESEARGDNDTAVTWWRARAALEVLDSRIAVRLVRTLDASGNRAAAIQYASAHEQLLKDELGVDPPPEFRAMTGQLRRETGSGMRLEPAARAVMPSDVESAAPAFTPSVNAARRASNVRYVVGALVLSLVVYGVVFVAVRRRDTPASFEKARAGVANQKGVSSGGHRTPSVAAHELYIRGTDQSMFRTDSGARTALRLLHEAVALDPTYAAAWEGLSRVYARLVLSPRNTTSDREQYSALAYEAALKAVSLDDSLAEARAALGLARMISFDFAAAEQELLRALDMAPTRAETHDKLVWLYLWMDRPAEALEHARRAVQLDPLSPGARAALAQALLGNDQCDEALAELDKVLRVQPPLLRAGSIAAQCYARKQRWPEATAVLRAQFETGEPTAVGLVAFLQARGGQRAEALRIREALIERWRRGAIGAFGLALADAGLGNLDNAVEWLDRSLLDRSLIGVGNNPAHIMVMGPLLEDLRHHREFARLRPRLGLLLSRGAP